MAKRGGGGGGGGSRRRRKGPPGSGGAPGGGFGGKPGGPRRKGKRPGGPPGSKGGGGGKRGKFRVARKADYYTQPGRGGVFMVLHRPVGNRIVPKICGVMPSPVHAKMLIESLEKAEGAVKDLFLEATDDGIEALETILAACVAEVLAKGPKFEPMAADAQTAFEPLDPPPPPGSAE
jgi:hypothetical protein